MVAATMKTPFILTNRNAAIIAEYAELIGWGPGTLGNRKHPSHIKGESIARSKRPRGGRWSGISCYLHVSQRDSCSLTSYNLPQFAHARVYLGLVAVIDIDDIEMPTRILSKNCMTKSLGVASWLSRTLMMFSASAIFSAPA